MKKLFSIISIILCVSMLMMGVSAAGTVVDEEEALAIFKNAMDKTCGLKYVEIQGIFREKTVYDDGTENSVDIEAVAARFRMIALSGKNISTETLMWNENSEITALNYVKDGYYYDVLVRKSYRYDEEMTIEYYIYYFTGTEPDAYKDDLQNLTARKTPDGYELRYKISYSYSYSSDLSYTIVLDKDYMIKSINVSYRNLDTHPISNTACKYAFVSVNEPFVIDFPRDLNTYKPFDE